jgi:hypothetical protein
MGLKEVKEAMRHNKPKTLWVGEKIKDVNEALDAIHKYTRKVAGAGWWLGLKTRLWWVLDEYEKVIHREMELGYAREGLLAVIEYLNQFENNPAKEKQEQKQEQKKDTRHTTITKNVDIDVDVDIERRGGRRVIELDREGRPIRDNRERHEHIHRDEYVVERDEDEYVEPQFRVSARDGFYDGRLDGPLATRPTWWAEQQGLNRSDEVSLHQSLSFYLANINRSMSSAAPWSKRRLSNEMCHFASTGRPSCKPMAVYGLCHGKRPEGKFMCDMMSDSCDSCFVPVDSIQAYAVYVLSNL